MSTTLVGRLVKLLVPSSTSQNKSDTSKQQKNEHAKKRKTKAKTKCEEKKRLSSRKQGQGKNHRKDITKYPNQFFL